MKRESAKVSVVDLETSIKAFIAPLNKSEHRRLFNKLHAGEFYVEIPEPMFERNDKNEMNSYRYCVLHYLFRFLRSDLNNAKRHELIKRKYGFFITYRMSRNLITMWKENYEENVFG